jgi:hypothetical protein
MRSISARNSTSFGAEADFALDLFDSDMAQPLGKRRRDSGEAAGTQRKH